MAPATSTAMPSNHVAFRSMERSMTLSDDHWFMVSHVMRVRGQTDELVRHLPIAVLEAFNKHPRMRIKMLKTDSTSGEIQPLFTSVDEVTSHSLLHITHKDAQAMTDAACQEFIQVEGQKPYDRYTQFAFTFHVWVDAENDSARVFVIADHYLCDGNSLNVVLNDVLDFAAQASRGAHATATPLPLSPCMYEALLQGHSFAAPALRLLMQRGVRTLLRVSPKFQALLPPNNQQEDFNLVHPPKNPSTILFANGTPENLEQIVAKCHAEHTTFFGAFSAAIFLAFILQSDALENHAFKMNLAVNFNLRDRVTTPIPKDAVGLFITASEMPTPVVDVPQQTFWDLARALKQRAVSTTASFPTIALPLIMMDQHFQRGGDPALADEFPLKAATLADADVSSLGKYPHSRTHKFATGDLKIETLHYTGHVPFLGAACYFYATSLDQVSYSLSHHMEEATGKALLDTAVAVMEGCWRVESNETLPQVAAKLTATP